jgi:hypothetical protein
VDTRDNRRSIVEPSAEAQLSRRACAALAGGAIVFSAAFSDAALAQEPDTQREGAVHEGSGTSALDSPDFDPGGETTLPVEVQPPPAGLDDSDESEDGYLLGEEPADDPDAPLALPPDPPAPQVDEETTAPPVTETPTTPPPTPPQPTPVEPPADPSVGRPERPRTLRDPGLDDIQHRSQPTGTGVYEKRPSLGRQATPAPRTGAPPGHVPVSGPTKSQVLVASQARKSPATDQARLHVVKPGESLWSIAQGLLGPDASPAQIAATVEQLWSLNAARIGTGDPDLLMVGTELRLP